MKMETQGWIIFSVTVLGLVAIFLLFPLMGDAESEPDHTIETLEARIGDLEVVGEKHKFWIRGLQNTLRVMRAELRIIRSPAVEKTTLVIETGNPKGAPDRPKPNTKYTARQVVKTWIYYRDLIDGKSDLSLSDRDEALGSNVSMRAPFLARVIRAERDADTGRITVTVKPHLLDINRTNVGLSLYHSRLVATPEDAPADTRGYDGQIHYQQAMNCASGDLIRIRFGFTLKDGTIDAGVTWSD